MLELLLLLLPPTCADQLLSGLFHLPPVLPSAAILVTFDFDDAFRLLCLNHKLDSLVLLLKIL